MLGRRVIFGLTILLLGAASAAQAQLVITMPRPTGQTPTTSPAAMPAAIPAAIPSVVRITPAATGSRLDYWTDLIREASVRFGIPERWIREVMRMESGGNPQALSSAGAMGLMQVIPSTYAKLRWQHGLGANPWEPRDNILAGAAYIREMYDLYGFPGFLAAYNAGPGRVDGFVNRSSILPAETVNYLSVVGSRLQGTTVAEGPLSAFLHAGGAPQASAAPAPMVVSMRNPTSQTASPVADASGLVPRGMLTGPQLIQMPSPTDTTLPAPVPLPPALVASLLRAPRR